VHAVVSVDNILYPTKTNQMFSIWSILDVKHSPHSCSNGIFQSACKTC